eukprot:TRINITY_DN2074_c0_g1_i4.p1 TRINITY_DN2074_c0_g1~~TRINITY_DN2074_c0_g1_i4.p1  ORF type:complete len:929 (-),score=221.78 TRINITY_DN2074_c0_g1_i4:134-2677(-)
MAAPLMSAPLRPTLVQQPEVSQVPSQQVPPFAPSAVPAVPTIPAAQQRTPGMPQPVMPRPMMPPTSPVRPTPGSAPAPRPASKIDPAQMPNPTSISTSPVMYKTSSGYPPSVLQPATIVDDGKCSPRFLRLTTYAVPASKDLATSCCIPLAAVVSPLADISANESIPVVDHGEEGPIRCNRCRAYMNPFVSFVNGGRDFVCKMCGLTNFVPDSYFSPLEASGFRADHALRPELSRGTVEYVASNKMYLSPNRTLCPPAVLFVLDVSKQSFSHGLVNLVTECLRNFLPTFPDAYPRVGFITYDSTVHFWDLQSKTPKMCVVPDVTDTFVPLSDGMFVKHKDSLEIISTLLKIVSNEQTSGRKGDSVLGAAITAATLALKPIGGKIIVFHSAFPVGAPAPLKERDDFRLYATDKEKSLYAPQGAFFAKLADQCALNRTSVDMFLCAQAYTDVATLSDLPRASCGQLFFFPDFEVTRDWIRFEADLRRACTRSWGYDASMRIRVSTGLSVSEYSGNFYSVNDTDIDLAAVDSDKTFVTHFKYDDKLEGLSEVVVQAALLYTTTQGERRVRVHTTSVPIAKEHATVYKSADVDAVSYTLATKAAKLAKAGKHATASTEIVDTCVDILAMYRKYCASTTTASQLILPESLKLLPVFTLAILKSPMLRPDQGPDGRCASIQRFMSASVANVQMGLYPRVFPLHVLLQQVGDATSFKIPVPLRLAADWLQPTGVYLFDDGCHLLVFVGKSASPEVLLTLFGVDSTTGVSAAALTSEFYTRVIQGSPPSPVCTLLSYLTELHGHPHISVRVVAPGSGSLELYIANLLVEDKGSSALPSYMDFLCTLHRSIHHKLV